MVMFNSYVKLPEGMWYHLIHLQPPFFCVPNWPAWISWIPPCCWKLSIFSMIKKPHGLKLRARLFDPKKTAFWWLNIQFDAFFAPFFWGTSTILPITFSTICRASRSADARRYRTCKWWREPRELSNFDIFTCRCLCVCVLRIISTVYT